MLSVLPYLMMLVIGLLGGPLADALERRRCLGATSVRKLFNTCGMGGQAALLLVLAAIVPATKAGGGGAKASTAAARAFPRCVVCPRRCTSQAWAMQRRCEWSVSALAAWLST